MPVFSALFSVFSFCFSLSSALSCPSSLASSKSHLDTFLWRVFFSSFGSSPLSSFEYSEFCSLFSLPFSNSLFSSPWFFWPLLTCFSLMSLMSLVLLPSSALSFPWFTDSATCVNDTLRLVPGLVLRVAAILPSPTVSVLSWPGDERFDPVAGFISLVVFSLSFSETFLMPLLPFLSTFLWRSLSSSPVLLIFFDVLISWFSLLVLAFGLSLPSFFGMFSFGLISLCLVSLSFRNVSFSGFLSSFVNSNSSLTSQDPAGPREDFFFDLSCVVTAAVIFPDVFLGFPDGLDVFGWLIVSLESSGFSGGTGVGGVSISIIPCKLGDFLTKFWKEKIRDCLVPIRTKQKSVVPLVMWRWM